MTEKEKPFREACTQESGTQDEPLSTIHNIQPISDENPEKKKVEVKQQHFLLKNKEAIRNRRPLFHTKQKETIDV